MISVLDARDLILAGIRALPARPVAVTAATGRVLRADAHATEDMPAFDRSAMDGYAVEAADVSERFRIIGEIQPGTAPTFALKTGECARIFTGAAIPQGASQVIKQEDVRIENGYVIPQSRARATHIRKRAEDARAGDVLLKAGARLGPGEVSLLAGIGVVEPMVSPACRVAHFVTGNELVDAGNHPAPGRIRDSNGPLVTAFLRERGCDLVRQERVSDDFDFLVETVRACENEFDLLLVSGGASVGEYDFGKRLLTTLGFQIHFDKVNLRPGKPLIFATRGPQAAFVLPGNPVSHFVILHVAVRLALELFEGAAPGWPLVGARLVEPFAHRGDARETFWPAQITLQNREMVVRALRWQSSGDATALAGANALLRLTGSEEPLIAGSMVSTLLLNFE